MKKFINNEAINLLKWNGADFILHPLIYTSSGFAEAQDIVCCQLTVSEKVGVLHFPFDSIY